MLHNGKICKHGCYRHRTLFQGNCKTQLPKPTTTGHRYTSHYIADSLSLRSWPLLSSMDARVKKISHHIISLTLAFGLVMIFYVLPLQGEMCSTMISAVDGENYSALQKRAFSSLRSTCRGRREPPIRCK